MKIIQITDTHLMSRGTELHGLNPCIRLEACVANINENHSDAEMCIITGDLTERGDIGAYQDFYEIIGRLSIPCHPLIGNHDHREKFCKIFPNVPRDEHGFVQQKLLTPVGRFLLLDTVEDGANWGSFCEKRGDWLRNELDKSGNEPVYLFMHHPPFEIGIPVLDDINLRDDSLRIHQILSNYTNIKHIFFGHVHRPVCGSWYGIPFSTMYGTNHQVQLDLNAKDYFPHTHEPPTYCVIFIESEQTTVHIHNYLDDSLYKRISF
jgi:3',5'-cyclic AMP phosphodiesterase CpdA